MTEVIELLKALAHEISILKTYVIGSVKNPAAQKEWLDGQEVMQYLHVSKRTLQNLRATGLLPYSQVNGKFYYKASDVEALLESNYSKPQSKTK